MNPIRVAHVTTSVSRHAGGLFESVRHLSQETLKNNVDVEVVGLRDQFTEEDLARWAPMPVSVFPVIGPLLFAYSPPLFDFLRRSSYDILHLHGVWQYPTSVVLRWARMTGRPYVVSSHGMLEPWALKRSRFRKAVVNWLYQNACLHEANCLRATAASEVLSMRQLGLKNPVALIPNGVPFPETLPARSAGRAKGKRRALFLSRVHPKKGLLNLARAWARIKPGLKSEWEVVLMGPDEGGHLAEVMGLIRELGLEKDIRYGGEVWQDSGKWQAYRDSDLFILPSYSENFGLVIAEALGCGVPVVTTRATPWEDLEMYRCGWWIETGEEPLVAALQKILVVPDEELTVMGLRGRKLVQRKYSWSPMGKLMAQVYQWLMGSIEKPDCVILD